MIDGKPPATRGRSIDPLVARAPGQPASPEDQLGGGTAADDTSVDDVGGRTSGRPARPLYPLSRFKARGERAACVARSE
ncbi:hypothetical protein HYQ44_009027 [Verticillium longisporum]|nr:hypothetical protein HYQ44_009027 [Verticillium longisporum]